MQNQCLWFAAEYFFRDAVIAIGKPGSDRPHGRNKHYFAIGLGEQKPHQLAHG